MPSVQRITGLTLLAAGLVLLALSGGYYAYGVVANAGLDELTFESERPTFVGSSYPENEPDVPAVSTAPAAQPDEPSAFPGSASRVSEAVRVEDVGLTDLPGAMVIPQSAVEDSSKANTASLSAQGGEDSEGPGVGTQELVAHVVATGAPESTAPTGADADDKPDVSVSIDVEDESVSQQTPLTSAEVQPPVVVEPQSYTAAAEDPAVDEFATPGVSGSDDEAALKAERFAFIRPIPESLQYELLAQRGSRYFAPEGMPIAEEPAPAVHMIIAAIGVDSKVQDLGIDLTADGRTWETPKRVVGHIPTTARPGDEGEGWYFGHLESPILGEGNVFSKLPEIAKLLRAGKTVEIILDGPDGRYVYQAYKSNWVEQGDLVITDSGNRDITLVTCYPRFHYDKRLLVTAALVGFVSS